MYWSCVSDYVCKISKDSLRVDEWMGMCVFVAGHINIVVLSFAGFVLYSCTLAARVSLFLVTVWTQFSCTGARVTLFVSFLSELSLLLLEQELRFS